MRGGFAPLPRGVNVSVFGATRGSGATRAITCKVVVDVTGDASSIAVLERARLPRGAKIGHRVVRDRSAWFVGCLHTGRPSWATTKGVECRCVQLVCSAAPFSEPRAPKTQERASRRHRRPRPSAYPFREQSRRAWYGRRRSNKPFLVVAPSAIQGRSRIRRLVLSRARGRTFRRQKRPSVSLRLHRPVLGLAGCRRDDIRRVTFGTKGKGTRAGTSPPPFDEQSSGGHEERCSVRGR
jgi:hypothetical protein